MDNDSEEIRLDGISFGKPFPIDEWDPPEKAAMYLILRKDDGMIIYVGESGNLDDREFWKGDHKYNCWVRVTGTEKNLAIAFYPMGGFDTRSKKDDRVQSGKEAAAPLR